MSDISNPHSPHPVLHRQSTTISAVNMSCLERLPNEILFNIFDRLSVIDLTKCCRLSRDLQQVAEARLYHSPCLVTTAIYRFVLTLLTREILGTHVRYIGFSEPSAQQEVGEVRGRILSEDLQSTRDTDSESDSAGSLDGVGCSRTPL